MMKVTAEERMIRDNAMANCKMMGGRGYAEVLLDWTAVDTAYQRELSARQLKNMIANFKPNECQTITLSYRDGVLYVIDGQHRTFAAKANGLRSLPAEIFFNLTAEEEAELFSTLNMNRRRPNPKETYKANLFCKNMNNGDVRVDMAIASLLDKHSIDHIRCMSAVRSIVKTNGDVCMDYIFTTIDRIYANDSWKEYNMYSRNFMNMLRKWYVEQTMDRDKAMDMIVKMTSVFNPSVFDAEVAKYKEKGMTSSKAYYSALSKLVNRSNKGYKAV